MTGAAREQVLVKDRVEWSNWLWAGAGLLVLLATVAAMIAAGTGDALARDDITGEYTVETYAWAGPLMIGTTLFGYPLIRTIFLVILRETVVRADAQGLVLQGKAAARAPWEEIDRVVFWRKRVTRLGIKRWEPQIGIVRKTERAENFQQAANAKTWTAADLRPNGVPEWLPGGIQKHSIRLSFRCAPKVAAAVARFAPDLPVTDQRRPGHPAPVPVR